MELEVIDCNFMSETSNNLLRGRFLTPQEYQGCLPIVIMLTGDGPKGTKSLSWTNLPPRLGNYGIASFLFDFEGLGFSNGERSKLTVTKAMDNFKTAFDIVLAQDYIDKNRIGIFASSFGGTVSLLLPEIINRVKLLGLKSPASFLADAYINECGTSELDKWLKEGYSETLEYDIEVLHDALKHNPFLSAPQIRTKTLISHGDADTIVPIRQSKLLHSILTCEKQLEVFEHVSHNYSEEDAWEKMADLFVTWFSNGL